MRSSPKDDNLELDGLAAVDLDEQRKLFNQEGVYRVDNISHTLPDQAVTYSDLLLDVRMDLVRKYVLVPPVLSSHRLATNHRKVFFAQKLPNRLGTAETLLPR